MISPKPGSDSDSRLLLLRPELWNLFQRQTWFTLLPSFKACLSDAIDTDKPDCVKLIVHVFATPAPLL